MLPPNARTTRFERNRAIGSSTDADVLGDAALAWVIHEPIFLAASSLVRPQAVAAESKDQLTHCYSQVDLAKCRSFDSPLASPQKTTGWDDAPNVLVW